MRHCPFYNCTAILADSVFACRQHWFSLSYPQRKAVYSLYEDYCADGITLEELRQGQQSILGERGDAYR